MTSWGDVERLYAECLAKVPGFQIVTQGVLDYGESWTLEADGLVVSFPTEDVWKYGSRMGVYNVLELADACSREKDYAHLVMAIAVELMTYVLAS